MISTHAPGPVCPLELSSGKTSLNPVIDKHSAALLLLLGFGGFSVILASIYKLIRKHVFKDFHNLDAIFDAGGNVSVSLTAVTVTSQLLWPADFLQTATFISKSGLGGSLWYSIGVVVVILSFPLFSLKLKTRAPGAKTFPQIVYARFGKPAHIMCCIFALGTNLVVITNLLLAGKTALEVLTKDASVEFVMLLLAVLFGSYCMIGGLGATFYISYFNTALIFISVSLFILGINYFATPETAAVASKKAMYDAAVCIKGPEGNFDNSLLTFRTRSGILYGIIILFIAANTSFCDQANWQSRIAAKPSQGVVGFLVAGFLWFGIPTSISFTTAMAYLSMSFQNGTHMLESVDIDSGYITPFIMEQLLNSNGAYLLLNMLAMALMSTGSGEIMAISSIIIYDICKTYIVPFRKGLQPTSCVLCGKDKVKNDCSCLSVLDCQDCLKDIHLAGKNKNTFGIEYKCNVHGAYRHYEDTLIRQKNWCMVWIVALIVPFGLIINETGMNLNWAILSGTALSVPFIVQLFLTLSWAKATGKGIIAGGVTGVVVCFICMLAVGSTYDGGLSKFYENTAQDYCVIAGIAAGLTSGSLVCVITSLCTTTVRTKADEEEEWMKTMSIDNPLYPYRALYTEELAAGNAGPNISADTMARIFKRAQRVAYIGGSISLVIFLVIIPSVALSFEVLTMTQFETWLTVCNVWCFAGLVFAVFVPPIEEGFRIYKRYKDSKNGMREAFGRVTLHLTEKL